MIAIVGIWSAYVLWAFSVRRVSWLSLRGSQFVLPLMALLAWLIVDLVAGYVTTDPLITALGGTSEELHLGYAPGVLWFVVALTSVVAAVRDAVCRRPVPPPEDRRRPKSHATAAHRRRAASVGRPQPSEVVSIDRGRRRRGCRR